MSDSILNIGKCLVTYLSTARWAPVTETRIP